MNSEHLCFTRTFVTYSFRLSATIIACNVFNVYIV